MIKNIIRWLIYNYVEKVWLAMLIWWFAMISLIWMVYFNAFQDFLHEAIPLLPGWNNWMSCDSISCIVYNHAIGYICLWSFLFFIMGIIEFSISIYRKTFFSLSEVYYHRKWTIIILLYISSNLIHFLYFRDNNSTSTLLITAFLTSILSTPSILLGSLLFFWVGKLRESIHKKDAQYLL
jgi:hypothetical protein